MCELRERNEGGGGALQTLPLLAAAAACRFAFQMISVCRAVALRGSGTTNRGDLVMYRRNKQKRFDARAHYDGIMMISDLFFVRFGTHQLTCNCNILPRCFEIA